MDFPIILKYLFEVTEKLSWVPSVARKRKLNGLYGTVLFISLKGIQRGCQLERFDKF